MNEKALIELSKGQWLGVWWAFAWRGVIVMVATFAVSLFVGFVLGLLAAIVVVPLKLPKVYWFIPLETISAIIGLVIGFIGFMIFLRWLFTARLFGYRFALIEATECAITTSELPVQAQPYEDAH